MDVAPRSFTENLGQLDDDDILFYDQRGRVWFTGDGAGLVPAAPSTGATGAPGAPAEGAVPAGTVAASAGAVAAPATTVAVQAAPAGQALPPA